MIANPAAPKISTGSLQSRSPLTRVRWILEDSTVRLVVLGLVAAHLLDLLTTGVLLSRNATEINPLSAAVVHLWGMSGLVMEKATVAGITLYNMAVMTRRWALVTGSLAAAITMVAVFWNLTVGL